jgi:hypothetical protein
MNLWHGRHVTWICFFTPFPPFLPPLSRKKEILCDTWRHMTPSHEFMTRWHLTHSTPDYRHSMFYFHLKSKVGNIFTKATGLCINLKICGVSVEKKMYHVTWRHVTWHVTVTWIHDTVTHGHDTPDYHGTVFYNIYGESSRYDLKLKHLFRQDHHPTRWKK